MPPLSSSHCRCRWPPSQFTHSPDPLHNASTPLTWLSGGMAEALHRLQPSSSSIAPQHALPIHLQPVSPGSRLHTTPHTPYLTHRLLTPTNPPPTAALDAHRG